MKDFAGSLPMSAFTHRGSPLPTRALGDVTHDEGQVGVQMRGRDTRAGASS